MKRTGFWKKKKDYLSVLLTGFLLAGLAMASTAPPVHAVQLSQFMDFASDTPLVRNDDDSVYVSLNASFLFFGEPRPELWVNNNGIITFDGPLAAYSPAAIPFGRQMVAPYLADVDTRHPESGLVYYGERLVGDPDLDTISALVRNGDPAAGFQATYAFVVTWDHVGYFDTHADPVNTFQVVLATDGNSSYLVFNYLDDGMWWNAGDASGGINGYTDELSGTPARAGFEADLTYALEISGSGTAEIANILRLDSNTGVPGQWVFMVNEGSSIPEPSDREAIEQIQEIMAVFAEGVENGDLTAAGSKKNTDNKMKTFANMLKGVASLVAAGDAGAAVQELESILAKCDGDPKPPDFIEGEGASVLESLLLDLIDYLVMPTDTY